MRKELKKSKGEIKKQRRKGRICATGRSKQRSLAQGRPILLKPKSSRLSDTFGAILAQASLISPKKVFVKKPR